VLSCEVFKYSNEDIDTGTDADTVQDKFANNGALGASGILDPFAKNQYIEDAAEGIINNVEANPFG